MMEWRYDDGGRAAAGYRGTAGDCGVRAVAIATERPYQEVYDEIWSEARKERDSKRRRGNVRRSPRGGVWRPTFNRYLRSLGWVWTPTMQIGSGCRVHLRADELPPGRLVVNLSKHWCAVVDGIIRDTHDPSRGGTRCVYGYWTRED